MSFFSNLVESTRIGRAVENSGFGRGLEAGWNNSYNGNTTSQQPAAQQPSMNSVFALIQNGTIQDATLANGTEVDKSNLSEYSKGMNISSGGGASIFDLIKSGAVQDVTMADGTEIDKSNEQEYEQKAKGQQQSGGNEGESPLGQLLKDGVKLGGTILEGAGKVLGTVGGAVGSIVKGIGSIFGF